MKAVFEFTVWKELDIPEEFDKRFSGVNNGDMFANMFYDMTINDNDFHYDGGEITGVYKTAIDGSHDEIIWEEC